MSQHKFDVAEAEKYGIEKAIILEHLRFHQSANEGNENLKFKGKSWAFIKPSTIKKMYPYLNYSSVRRWLRELEEDGVIESCKPEARGGYHLKYYHVKSGEEPNNQNDNSIGQNARSIGHSDQSYNDQNAHSSIVTNVNNTMCTNTLSVAGKAYNEEDKIVDIVEEVDLSVKPTTEEEKYSYLAVRIWQDVDQLRPNNKITQGAKLGKWFHPVRLMVEQDDRNLREIWDLWKKIRKDDFWRVNVLSTEKLRGKFDELAIKFEHKQSSTNGRSTSEEIINTVDREISKLSFDD